MGQPACQRNGLPHQRPPDLAHSVAHAVAAACSPLPCACAGRGGGVPLCDGEPRRKAVHFFWEFAVQHVWAVPREAEGVPLCDGEPRRKAVHCFVLWLGLHHGVPAHRGGCGCKTPATVPPCMLAAGTQGGRTVPGCTAFTTSVPAMLCRAALWRDSRTWCSSRRACCGEWEGWQRARGGCEGREVQQAAVALGMARSPPLPLLPVSPRSARWWCACRAAQPCGNWTPWLPSAPARLPQGQQRRHERGRGAGASVLCGKAEHRTRLLQRTPACVLASWADAAACVVPRPPPTPPLRCCCCCCSSLLGCINAHCFDHTMSAAMPAHFPPRQVPVAPGKSRLMSLLLATNKKFR